MITQLVYTSRATATASDQDLPEILRCSQRNNPELGLTGILAMTGDTFLQLIEGDEEQLRPLVDFIAGDRRHTDLRVLVDRIVEARAFPDWSMAFGLIERHPSGRAAFLERLATLSRDGSDAAQDDLVALVGSIGPVPAPEPA